MAISLCKDVANKSNDWLHVLHKNQIIHFSCVFDCIFYVDLTYCKIFE